jgi:hypothetical protein
MFLPFVHPKSNLAKHISWAFMGFLGFAWDYYIQTWVYFNRKIQYCFEKCFSRKETQFLQ